MTTATTNSPALPAVDTDIGPKCSRPSIWRHYAPEVEDIDLNGEECVWHVMVTSGAGPVIGKLLRWVSHEEVGYEARIDGTEETAGISDITAFSIDSLSALECVLADLRYEWACILGEHSKPWTYNFWSRWPDEVYPDA